MNCSAKKGGKAAWLLIIRQGAVSRSMVRVQLSKQGEREELMLDLFKMHGL